MAIPNSHFVRHKEIFTFNTLKNRKFIKYLIKTYHLTAKNGPVGSDGLIKLQRNEFSSIGPLCWCVCQCVSVCLYVFVLMCVCVFVCVLVQVIQSRATLGHSWKALPSFPLLFLSFSSPPPPTPPPTPNLCRNWILVGATEAEVGTFGIF